MIRCEFLVNEYSDNMSFFFSFRLKTPQTRPNINAIGGQSLDFSYLWFPKHCSRSWTNSLAGSDQNNWPSNNKKSFIYRHSSVELLAGWSRDKGHLISQKTKSDSAFTQSIKDWKILELHYLNLQKTVAQSRTGSVYSWEKYPIVSLNDEPFSKKSIDFCFSSQWREWIDFYSKQAHFNAGNIV